MQVIESGLMKDLIKAIAINAYVVSQKALLSCRKKLIGEEIVHFDLKNVLLFYFSKLS